MILIELMFLGRIIWEEKIIDSYKEGFKKKNLGREKNQHSR